MKEYDPNKPTKYINYLDANNTYGWEMCKPLPTHGLERMDEDDLKSWKNIPCSSSSHLGCILEIDLKYPRELKELCNDYPLAPELLRVDNVDVVTVKYKY